MTPLHLNDKPNDAHSIEIYFPSPEVKQRHSWEITSVNDYLKGKFDYDTSDVVAALLNRMTTMGVDLTLYSGLLENIKERLTYEGCEFVALELSPKNKKFGIWLTDELEAFGVSVALSFHSHRSISFSCSDSGSAGNLKATVSFFFQALIMTILSVMGAIYRGVFGRGASEIDIFWMSFANNRERVDFPFLSKLHSSGLNVAHLNSSKFKRPTRFSVNAYFDYRLAPTILSATRIVITFMLFHRCLKDVLIRIQEETALKFPLNYRSSHTAKLWVHALNSCLLAEAIKIQAADRNIVAMYRGGNADGIVLISEFTNAKVTLLPHGTEFDCIDHNTINWITANFLPSEKVVTKWRVNERQAAHVDLVATGRLEYQELRNAFVPASRKELLTVGVVLTYGSSQSARNFVSSILNIFSKTTLGEVQVLVKQRPNLTHDLQELSQDPMLKQFDGGINDFLNEASLVVVGLSPFGVVGMVGYDAISLGIPTLYYFPDTRFSLDQLGYSWPDEANPIAFQTESGLTDFLCGFDKSESLLEHLRVAQQPVRDLLGSSNEVDKKIINYAHKLLKK